MREYSHMQQSEIKNYTHVTCLVYMYTYIYHNTHAYTTIREKHDNHHHQGQSTQCTCFYPRFCLLIISSLCGHTVCINALIKSPYMYIIRNALNCKFLTYKLLSSY